LNLFKKLLSAHRNLKPHTIKQSPFCITHLSTAVQHYNFPCWLPWSKHSGTSSMFTQLNCLQMFMILSCLACVPVLIIISCFCVPQSCSLKSWKIIKLDDNCRITSIM
jgi:hypothetical protein